MTDGDFHVFLENGKPKLGVRFIGDEVEEIQGEENNGRIPLNYFDVFKKYIHTQNLKLGFDAKSELAIAKQTIQDIEQLKVNIGDAKKLENIDDAEYIFKLLRIETKRSDTNNLIIDNYNTEDYNLCTLLGLDEQKLFNYVEEVEGNVYFDNTSITKLNNLKSIGGTVSFEDSSITDLGKLEYIGGDAIFQKSKLTNLGTLKIIGGNAYFTDSEVIDLGQLTEIKGRANFSDSKIENIDNLEVLGGAIFSNSKIKNLGKLKYIGADVYIMNSNLKEEDLKNITVKGEIKITM